MWFLTVLYASLFYVAASVLTVGLLFKIVQYARTPAPLKIPTTPAPTTRSGVVLRLIREVVFFESLFKGSKWTWVLGWTFHIGLLLVTLRHLRYFIDPVWFPVELVQPFGIYGGMAMVVGLAGLWARRVFVDRVRYISSATDHLMLSLLVLLGVSGLMMTYVVHADIVAVKLFFRGLLSFELSPLPADPILLVHLLLVVTLMMVFPFSKLLHVPGLFFSPSRYQVDNPREERHVAPWANSLDP